MSANLPAGPYRTLHTPEGDSVPFYIMPFDKAGSNLAPETRQNLLANLAGVTDIFVFSHGWNNDWTTATNRYESFIDGMQKMRARHQLRLPAPYKPLLIGIFWPSQLMEWLDSESGPGFAAGNPEEDAVHAAQLSAAVDEVSEDLPPEKRARFQTLVRASTLAEGEDRELAALLAELLAGGSDEEAGVSAASDAVDLLTSAVAFETPEPDYDAIGTATPATSSDPHAAGGAGDLLRVLDPRSITKPFTVWLMKDRAGKVGAFGVAPLLESLLAAADPAARIHLIGHSYGCKVVMTAASVMAEPARPLESALLLQAAVSQYAFSPNVPDRGVPGGFEKALSRIRRPVMATFSRYDSALTLGFHCSVRRHDDLGELQFAGEETPSRYGALGGFGPQATKSTVLQIRDPGDAYDFGAYERVVGVNGSRAISGHGDISNPATWWAEYSLLTAHLHDA